MNITRRTLQKTAGFLGSLHLGMPKWFDDRVAVTRRANGPGKLDRCSDISNFGSEALENNKVRLA